MIKNFHTRLEFTSFGPPAVRVADCLLPPLTALLILKPRMRAVNHSAGS